MQLPTHVPYRPIALLYALATLTVSALFVAGVIDEGVPYALVVYGMLFGACAIGLWMRTHWGRVLALVVALANAGIGLLATVAAIAAGVLPVAPLVFAAVNAVVVLLLSRGTTKGEQ